MPWPQRGPASTPVSGHTGAVSKRRGSTSGPGFMSRIAASMARRKMRPAPVMPETFFIGVPSKLPAHTATVRSRVKPAVQLST